MNSLSIQVIKNCSYSLLSNHFSVKKQFIPLGACQLQRKRGHVTFQNSSLLPSFLIMKHVCPTKIHAEATVWDESFQMVLSCNMVHRQCKTIATFIAIKLCMKISHQASLILNFNASYSYKLAILYTCTHVHVHVVVFPPKA